MPKPARLKTPAVAYAPQTIDDCAADIRKIGDLQRKLTYAQAEMNDAIAEITERYQPVLQALRDQIAPLQTGVQTWCDAHRHDLTRGGKVKSASFVTGEVQWRQRPPSVSVRGTDSVIELLASRGLDRFLRVKTEINKDAILADPDAARGVPGLSIVTGVEDFVITPFEIEP